jgi:hypothetical protein
MLLFKGTEVVCGMRALHIAGVISIVSWPVGLLLC